MKSLLVQVTALAAVTAAAVCSTPAYSQSVRTEHSYQIYRAPWETWDGLILPMPRDQTYDRLIYGTVYVGRNTGPSENRSFNEFRIDIFRDLPGPILLGMTYYGREYTRTRDANGRPLPEPPFEGTITISTYNVTPGVAPKFDQALTGNAGTLDAGVMPGPGPSDFLPFDAYPRYEVDVTGAVRTALAHGDSWLGLAFAVDGPSFVPGEYRLMEFVLVELKQASPIPEPETYALMIAGLGAMGFVARRRQRG